MCFAGEGGGNGRRKNLLGVEPLEALAGEGDTPGGSGLADTPCGYGLGHGLWLEDLAGVFFTDETVTAPLPDCTGVWSRSAETTTVVVVAAFDVEV